MAFALVFIGLILIVTGSRNTYAGFGAQLQSDFTGSNNFITWIVALGVVGALGYIKNLRTFSHYFMALIIVGLFLSNGGFFQNFQKALATGPTAPTAAATPTLSIGADNSPTTAANVDAKTASATSGAQGQAATSAGQSKFNGWVNYGLKKLFGG